MLLKVCSMYACRIAKSWYVTPPYISHLSMLAMQNLGLAVFVIVADVIKEKFGYIYLEITFLIVLYLTFLAGM